MAAKKFKIAVIKIVLGLLGRGVLYGYCRDSRIRAELDSLGEDCRVKLTVLPVGPSIIFGKSGGAAFARRCDFGETADITLSLKGVDSAFLMLTGRLGLSDGYAQHRFTVCGDLYKVMSIVRAINVVESCLFPRVISKKLMNPVPKREVNMLRYYAGTLTVKGFKAETL